MVRYTKESIQSLRDKTDIVDVVGKYVSLKKVGASFKGLCPFHEEKTPSFIVNKSSGSYHCFGCAAHGDAISFLMQYERLSFQQATEFLAERAGISLMLEEAQSDAQKEEDRLKKRVQQCLEEAMRWYHAILLYSPLAEEARLYLERRGLAADFLRSFAIGYAPSLQQSTLIPYLQKKGCTMKEMVEAGLLSKTTGKEFFPERIVFPIMDARGTCLGFSGRKFLEHTFGGKYINTTETLLFKKSKLFFGLYYSKRRMAKDRLAILVEGQIDALQLIHAGFQMTVATLGTAFGESHVDLLRALGVEQVYLAFDQDVAGRQSAEKAGHLLMKKGVDVRIVQMKDVKDPDECLQKQGAFAFFERLLESVGYIDFLVEEAKRRADFTSPAEKHTQVDGILEHIYEWDQPIVIHESIRVLSRLTGIPEELLKTRRLSVSLDKTPVVSKGDQEKKKADDIIEVELIRHLFFSLEKIPEVASFIKANLSKEELSSSLFQRLFDRLFSLLEEKKPLLLINLMEHFDTDEIETCQALFSEQSVRQEKALQAIIELCTKIKERAWRQKREKIREEIEKASSFNEEKALLLAKEMALLGEKPSCSYCIPKQLQKKEM